MPSPSKYPFPTRHPRWLRVFLVLFVLDMGGRSILSGLTLDGWPKELSVRSVPKGLPTQPELERIRSGKSTYSSVGERHLATLGGIAEFYSPVPSAETRRKLKGGGDWLKYSLVWLRTRMNFIGKFTLTNHSWPMFSPNTRKARAVVRSRLFYADGATLDHYPLNEPRDFNDYSRWFVKRPQKIDERLQTHENARLGMANYLRHTHPASPGGAPLEKIEMYKFAYRFPRIGDDVRKHWQKIQKEAKPELIWRFDVASGKGSKLDGSKPSSARPVPGSPAPGKAP